MKGQVLLYEQYDEKELLLRIAEGDEEVFRLVYDRYRQKIYSYAYNLTDSAVLADEVIQEVFLKVWVNREKLAGVEHFNAWVHAIARNYVFDALKAAAKERAAMQVYGAGLKEDEDAVDDVVFSRINEQLLREALELLTPQQKQVFELSRYEGLKRKEVAARMRLSENTVKTHLAAAVQTISRFVSRKDVSTLLWIFLLQEKS